MSPGKNEFGETLRRLRRERQLSLTRVAEKAGVSVATLSRVETNKQSVDVGLVTTLARILGVLPSALLGGSAEGADGIGTLARRLASLRPEERMKVFAESLRRRDTRQLAAVIDELLSSIDLLREELVQVQRAMKRGKR
jgi:transcriptional regulator with XRE-family HTH domain